MGEVNGIRVTKCLIRKRSILLILPFLWVEIPIILLLFNGLVTTFAGKSPRFAGEYFVHKLDLRSIALITDVSVMNRNSTKAFAEFLTCFESTETVNLCLKRTETSTKSTKTANLC